MIYLFGEGTHEVQTVVDHHSCGLFSKEEWLEMIVTQDFKNKRCQLGVVKLNDDQFINFMGIKPELFPNPGSMRDV